MSALVEILVAFGAYLVAGMVVLLLLGFVAVTVLDARDRVRARRRRQRRPGYLAPVVSIESRRRAVR